MKKYGFILPYFIVFLIVSLLLAAAIVFIDKDYESRKEVDAIFKYKPGDMVECLVDDKTGMVIDSINDGGGVNEYFIRFDSSKGLVRMKEFEIMDAEK